MKIIVTTSCLACMLVNCGSGGSLSFGWKSSKRASQRHAESPQSAPLVSEQESRSNLPITLEGSPTTSLLEGVRTMNQLHTPGPPGSSGERVFGHATGQRRPSSIH